jgi:RNA polymerase subunit RPABC4/transcription elongation factor Spt4
MRLWIVGLLAIGMMLGQGTAGSAAPRPARKAKPAGLAYLCPTCGVGASSSEMCPLCKKATGRVATYACLKCQVSSYHTAPCPNCREPMESVASQYRECSRCGHFVKKAAKACPVCAKKGKAHRRRR